MYQIVLTALGGFFSWVFTKATVKFAFAAVILGGFALLFDILISLLPAWFDASSLLDFTNAFPPSLWFFIDYFKLQEGISIMLSALATRFIIRRLPFIG